VPEKNETEYADEFEAALKLKDLDISRIPDSFPGISTITLLINVPTSVIQALRESNHPSLSTNG